MRVIDFSSYWGRVLIPSCWTCFVLRGHTYDVVDDKIRPRFSRIPHTKPGKKPTKAMVTA